MSDSIMGGDDIPTTYILEARLTQLLKSVDVLIDRTNTVDDDRLAKAEGALSRIIDRLEQTDEYDYDKVDISEYQQLNRELETANSRYVLLTKSLTPWDKDEKIYVCLICQMKSKIRLTISHPASCPICGIFEPAVNDPLALETTHDALNNLLALIAMSDPSLPGDQEKITSMSIYNTAMAVVKANFKDYGLPTTLAFVKDKDNG